MSFLEKDPNAPTAWLGDLPITSRYTAGLAGERFFRAISPSENGYFWICPSEV